MLRNCLEEDVCVYISGRQQAANGPKMARQ